MTVVIAPTNLAAQLRDCQGIVEIRDEDGATIGFFESLALPCQEEFAKTPYSVEELQQLRQQRTGKPLSEILERLERSHPR
jgi:hypothetical protein